MAVEHVARLVGQRACADGFRGARRREPDAVVGVPPSRGRRACRRRRRRRRRRGSSPTHRGVARAGDERVAVLAQRDARDDVGVRAEALRRVARRDVRGRQLKFF